VAIALLLAGAPVYAITAGDVLDKMTEKERAGYISGAVEMAMFQAATDQHNENKSRCVLEWFYGTRAADGVPLKDPVGPSQIIAAFNRFRDQPAIGVIALLINRACGK
jgi:hypothetical protein